MTAACAAATALGARASVGGYLSYPAARAGDVAGVEGAEHAGHAGHVERVGRAEDAAGAVRGEETFGSEELCATSSWWVGWSWAAGGVARVAHREKGQPGEAWTGIDEAAADNTSTGAYAATAVDRRCCDAGHVAKETQPKRENSTAACGRT